MGKMAFEVDLFFRGGGGDTEKMLENTRSEFIKNSLHNKKINNA